MVPPPDGVGVRTIQTPASSAPHRARLTLTRVEAMDGIVPAAQRSGCAWGHEPAGRRNSSPAGRPPASCGGGLAKKTPGSELSREGSEAATASALPGTVAWDFHPNTEKSETVSWR